MSSVRYVRRPTCPPDRRSAAARPTGDRAGWRAAGGDHWLAAKPCGSQKCPPARPLGARMQKVDSEADAIQVAKNFARANDWPWTDESVYACKSTHDAPHGIVDAWFVTTRPDEEWVANVHIVIEVATGTVLHSSFRPAVVNPISRERAVELARVFAQQNDLPWSDEFDVVESEHDTDDGQRVNCWAVSTNPTRLGGNLDVVLDAETGEVLDSWFANR